MECVKKDTVDHCPSKGHICSTFASGRKVFQQQRQFSGRKDVLRGFRFRQPTGDPIPSTGKESFSLTSSSPIDRDCASQTEALADQCRLAGECDHQMLMVLFCGGCFLFCAVPRRSRSDSNCFLTEPGQCDPDLQINALISRDISAAQTNTFFFQEIPLQMNSRRTSQRCSFSDLPKCHPNLQKTSQFSNR
jgi:hypothetical protein